MGEILLILFFVFYLGSGFLIYRIYKKEGFDIYVSGSAVLIVTLWIIFRILRAIMSVL